MPGTGASNSCTKELAHRSLIAQSCASKLDGWVQAALQSHTCMCSAMLFLWSFMVKSRSNMQI